MHPNILNRLDNSVVILVTLVYHAVTLCIGIEEHKEGVLKQVHLKDSVPAAV